MRYLLPLLAATVLFSCRPEEVDIERPTAQIEIPGLGDVVFTADGLRLVATLKDNTGLLQYKLTLNGLDSLNGVGADSTLTHIQINGTEESKGWFLDEVIPLPETTFNGQYQLILTCLDIEGNESLKDTVNFEIVNSTDPDAPVFNVAGPTPDDTLSIGQGFQLSGEITDQQSLIFADIEVSRTDGAQAIYEFEFSVIQNNSVGFDLYLQVDSTWTQGAYQVYYTAWDNYSGISHSIPFHVLY